MNVKSLLGTVFRRLTAYSATNYCFLLLGALLALAINALIEQKSQRFVPFPGSGYGVALDTKTGKSCLTDPYVTRSAHTPDVTGEDGITNCTLRCSRRDKIAMQGGFQWGLISTIPARWR